LLQRETADFITQDLWLPKQSGLNSVDYRMWSTAVTCLSKIW